MAEGITVNGLAIANDHPPFAYTGPVPLADYYRDAVIGGLGAFVVAATGLRRLRPGRSAASWSAK